jgi:hypothetical protein
MSKKFIPILIISLVCLYLDVAFSQSFIFSAVSLSSICIITITSLWLNSNSNLVFAYVLAFSLLYGLAMHQNLASLILAWAFTAGLIQFASQVLNFHVNNNWWSLGFLNLLGILLILQGNQWTIVQYILFIAINLAGVKFISWLTGLLGEQQHLRYDW